MKRIFLLALFLLSPFFVSCSSVSAEVHEGKKNFQSHHYDEAFARLSPAAIQGNADAEYAVGYMYYYGLGTSKNKHRAMTFIRRAAAQGQPEAVKALDLINDQHYISTPVPLAIHQPEPLT